MTQFEIVVHVAAELDGATPEEAAAVFKHELRAGVDPGAVLLGLAVWRPWDGSRATPLPSPLPQQLKAFFAGVEESAADAEVAFRIRVAQIMADSAARNSASTPPNEFGIATTTREDPVGDAWEADMWEMDGGAIAAAPAAAEAIR